jgi:hypothetical protein
MGCFGADPTMNKSARPFVSLGELLTKETNMKRIAIALLASAAALAATSARAETRVNVGINVGTPVYRTPAPVVVHTPPPAVVYAPAPVVVEPRGYWKEVVVKTWVPERWVSSRDRWGRHVRVCEPGYFTYRTDRVWVDGRGDNGHHNGHAYGHDNRGYDNRGYSYNDPRDNRGGWNR